MSRVFGYIRVSTIKQGQQGVSLQEQRSAIERYAEGNDHTIITWFEEQETAAKRGRPIFTKMLKELRGGKVDGVIIHKIDRSARNLKDWADLGQLIDGGVEVHFAHESLDLHSRGGRLSADIQAVIAADFIRNLREETRKGFYGRLKQGLYPLPAPLGYIDKGRGKAKELDPVKAPLVKKAFELYSTGNLNLNDLREELHKLGLRNNTGRKISKNGLSVLLNNSFYIGIIRLRSTGETFQGVHTPLITSILFNRVQAILSGKYNKKIRKHDFLFRRLITCKNCNYSLIGEYQKGHTYYRCHTKECSTKSMREDEIESIIRKLLLQIQLTDWEATELLGKIDASKVNWEQERKSQIASIELHLKKLRDRLGRLTDAYLDQTIDKELFENRKHLLYMEKKEMEDTIYQIKTEKQSIPDKIKKFLELVKSISLTYENGILEEKRDILQKATSNRSVQGKNVYISIKSPYLELGERSKMLYSAPYRDRPRTFNRSGCRERQELIDKLYCFLEKFYTGGGGRDLK
jgi:site-specific DNA recombinase